MKPWIFRISIALNILVIAVALAAWFNRDMAISIVLDEFYAMKTSFFDSYALQSGDVVMLGDSITDGGRWEELFPAISIKNRGIPGDTTTGVLARMAQIVAAKPAAVFLKIGTNDLARVPERAVSYQQYRQIITTIQSASPTTDIYLQSLLPRGVEFREEVEAYNGEIRAMAEELNVTYIDLYPAFLADDGSLRDELTRDELHLTGEGYKLWQSLLEPSMSGY